MNADCTVVELPGRDLKKRARKRPSSLYLLRLSTCIDRIDRRRAYCHLHLLPKHLNSFAPLPSPARAAMVPRPHQLLTLLLLLCLTYGGGLVDGADSSAWSLFSTMSNSGVTPPLVRGEHHGSNTYVPTGRLPRRVVRGNTMSFDWRTLSLMVTGLFLLYAPCHLQHLER